MNKKIIAVYFFNFSRFLQNQVISKSFKKSRKHYLISLNTEKIAILFYRWAIWLNPNFSEAHYELGKLLTNQGKWQEAATSFHQAIENNYSNFFNAYFYLGRMLLKSNRFSESIPIFRRAVEIRPHHLWSSIFLGDALSKTGEISEAIKIYKTALQREISKTHPHFREQLQNAQQSCIPNFLIIGKAKCGTSSLYSYLTQHPQILPAIQKEIHFWHSTSNFDRGLDWYLAHFPSICTNQNFITGEATPRYLDHSKAAQRLFQVFPKMKLIVLLRDPVDRAISEYYMMFLEKKIEHRSLEVAIFSELETLTKQLKPDSNKLSYLSSGIYIKSLNQWMEVFPKEQFLILRSEDLFSDPATTVNEIFQFLGVKPYQLKEYKKKNTGNYPPISKSMRKILSNYFQPYNQKLEEYLDRKFDWDN